MDLDDAKKLMEVLNEIKSRENWSFTRLAWEAFNEFALRHGRGNPVIKITNYIDENEESPMKVMCSYIGGALSDGKIFCKLVPGGVWKSGLKCYTCQHNRLRKKEQEK